MDQHNIELPFRRPLILILLWLISSACLADKPRGKWFPPIPVEAKKLSWFGEDNASGFPPYEHAYAMAREFETQGREACVDYYFQAATLAWPHVVTRLTTGRDCGKRAGEVYQSSLEKLLSTGHQFRRFQCAGRVKIHTADGWKSIPIVYSGFPWQPVEYHYFEPVGTYSSKDLNKQFREDGLGVATVAINRQKGPERFRRPRRVHSATAILHPVEDPETTHVLHVFDSRRISVVQLGSRKVPLRRDLSAPFGYVLKDEQREYVQSFLQPGSQFEDEGLFLIEPFQRGKIPVIFVHGLLSDPFTWVNLVNELRVHPELIERYQFWGFEYSTGAPFLLSAAQLRRQLKEVQAQYDPAGMDPAMRQAVLIGHSMGGLVSKLQITHSGDLLWKAVSNCPFHDVLMTGGMQRKLADAFFFEPLPMVTRVVYAGTPHRGSPWARRSVGSLGSRLVDEPDEDQSNHEQLIEENPGVFSTEFTRRIPTSIDMLREDSPLLLAIDKLPVKPHVQQHSIIGSYRKMVHAGDSDGVVPVSSARRPGAVSEKIVPAKHTKIHRNEEGVNELIRILRLHGLPQNPQLQNAEPLPSPAPGPGNQFNGNNYDF